MNRSPDERIDPNAGRRDVLQDRTMEVETPEHVSIEYPLAGLGSRFAALLADLIVIGILLFAVPLVLLVIALLLKLSPSDWAGFLLPFFVIYLFLVTWGYFFCFEAFRDGQTPGKKWMSIRVVMDGGYPITVEASGIRNLIRLIDLLLGGLVGGFFMLVHPRAKRLGDMAASTVVVRELPGEFPEVPEHSGDVALPRLADAGFQALEKFVERRSALSPEVRVNLSREMASKLYGREPRRGEETADAYLLRFHAEERSRRLAAHRGGQAGTAAAVSLVRAKRSRWEEFRGAVQRVRKKGLASVGELAVGDFCARYREMTADLARARTYGGSPGTIFALERAVGAGHNLLYRPGRQSLRRLLDWLSRGFPRLVRKRWLPITCSAVLLFAPLAFIWTLLLFRPDLERQLAPSQLIAMAEEAPRRRAEGKGYTDVLLSHGFMSSAITTNNLKVSFLVFALGVTAGVGTAAVLIFNGLSIGTALAVFHNRSVLDVIGIFVLPHGVIELTAISIAGGAGLWMGSAFLVPGRKKRILAFRERAREAISLISGVILLLIVAGLIEGFISPADLPESIKMAVALVAAALLALYLLVGGRRR